MDLNQLGNALAAVSALSSQTFPIHHLEVFLLVAEKGRCTYEEIQEELNLANSSTSRTVHALGATHRKGYDGLDLLQVTRDPDEGRRYLVTLTPKGEKLKRTLQRL